MNIRKVKREWLSGNPKVQRFSNLFTFVQFCWEYKLTPENSATVYDEDEGKLYIVEKENEDEFN